MCVWLTAGFINYGLQEKLRTGIKHILSAESKFF